MFDSIPDLIYANGIVRTLDAANPVAEAVAVKDGRIMAVGTTRDMRALAGGGTREVSLDGKLCIPSFFDSHFHYYQWSLGRREIDLSTAGNFAQAMEFIRSHGQGKDKSTWLTGYGFNESDWPENKMPVSADLDAAGEGRPVLVWRCDLHLAVASKEAMRIAGVDENTPDPRGGIIERDASGKPTGVFREGAINLIRNFIPDPSDDELESAMFEGISALHEMGTTAIHDVRLTGVQYESARTFRTWQTLRHKDKLNLRCWAAIPGECLQLAVDMGLRTDFGDDRLRIGHVKYFMDGGMGARTGWVLSPYLDTGETGVCLYEPKELAEEVRLAHENGLAVMVHAIGDRASHEIVGVYEELFKSGCADAPALPHRIEHAQMIRPEDIARLRGLPVAVSAQPPNMILDINMIDACMGELGRHAYPFRSLFESGAELMFSSDCPVCDPRPLVGIHAAVTRARKDGTPGGGWYPDQKMSVEQAVRCYTSTPAKVHGAGDRFGTIRPGLHADMVVLDNDIFDMDPAGIAETSVDMTIFNGETVYAR